MFKHKKVLIGITGSIAAYKMVYLVRALVKEGAEVRVIMTPSATQFITPLTLSTLSKHEVYDGLADSGNWNNHVELGLWADVFLIAPLTANSMAKLANGLCDNMLTAVYLSAKCPVLFAPAMDLDMWKHPSTQANLKRLESYGNSFIPVGTGELASGLYGEGRMAEPEEMLAYLQKHLERRSQVLAGQRILLTAGPTHERLDPVRYIGNRSSGKMGFALAGALARRGAQVVLVTGPTQEQISHPLIQRRSVQSAQEMYEAAQEVFATADWAILAAAVADFTPKKVAAQKIKKKEGQEDLQIELKRTVDIAATLGQQKTAQQVLIGFALETENAEANALRKLERKNLDWIVLNSLADKGAGFQVDTNKVKVFGKGESRDFPLMSKKQLAEELVDYWLMR